MAATWGIADNSETLISTDNGVLSTQLDFTLSQPALWSQLVGAGLDPFSVTQSLGAEYTRGNGINGGSIGFETQVDIEDGQITSVNQVMLSGSIAAGFVGGSFDITLVRDANSPTGFSVSEVNGFSGLNIILGEQGQLLGLTVGQTAGVQAGYFFEWNETSGSNATVGIDISASQGLVLGSLDASGSLRVSPADLFRDISDLSVEQLTDLYLHAYDTGINPLIEPSTLQQVLIPLIGLLELLNPSAERRIEALDRFFAEVGIEKCFSAGTLIDMWPRDLDLEPNAEGHYDLATVIPLIWTKPIEEIVPTDIVVSFTAEGNLVPGKVSRIFTNKAILLLDYFGTGVTPGHVYYRPDSKRPSKFEALIDVLRDDGILERSDGVHIRAATGGQVGSVEDGFVWAVAGTMGQDGSVVVVDKRRLRLGTRIVTEDGSSVSIGDAIASAGGVVTADELIADGTGEKPFYWSFGPKLPLPEDYILQRSGVTLEDIYRAAEWEVRPHMPPPLVLDGGPVQPLDPAEREKMAANVPEFLKG
ncbi:hypothetical protein [Algirhabdus cladophorae]|uniref:hypothetical protein n=1 Tax=Algirhabdus cladophorae TaxID=3377108 RepID=UPI003B849585